MRDKNAFVTGKAYKWNQNKQNYRDNQNAGIQVNSKKLVPHSHSTIHSKSKIAPGTKRQFHGDSTQDQKAKKQVLESTPKLPHLVPPLPETSSNHSTQKSQDTLSSTTMAPSNSL